jgi:hypothetical protein
MSSTFTWLDYSEADRRKMLDVINAFREKETRDELGFGSVRDAFADSLFPGTSTIQTRARYFLFVPWIYLRLERERVSASDIARQGRRDEVRLIEALLRGGETNEGDGVIGRRARAALQRLPSSVYWLGLATWGIRSFDGSLDQYHRSLKHFYEAARTRRRMRVEDDDLLDEPIRANWHPNIPDPPPDFLEQTTFRLTFEEADYLSERIRIRTRGSLLAFLLDANGPPTNSNFPWEHLDLGAFPVRLREQVAHAQNFSEITHGAPLLYNLMLAKLTRREDLVEHYRALLQDWARQIEERWAELTVWDLARFWAIIDSTGANVMGSTRRFIERWIEAIRQPGVAVDVADNTALQQLVHDREVALKHRLSRLENPRARELWSGQAGIGQLNYRWFAAQRMLADIHDGLTTR